MLTTYINDRKLADYPFYGLKKPRPFPPGCITHLGVCVQDQPVGCFFASAISISMDGVLVSLCLEENGVDKDIGSVYVASGQDSAGAEFEKDDVKYAVSMMVDRSLLQNSYGSYTGRFYLDPRCVSYVSDTVAGNLKQVVINGQTHQVDNHLDFACSGDLIGFTVPEESLTDSCYKTYLKAGAEVNETPLVYKPVSTAVPVRGINTATPSGVSPQFVLVAGDSSITFGVKEKPSALVVTIQGNTDFPNCYAGKGDEA